MNPTIDLVRGELERLFTLDEMTKMSERLLGLRPEEVGGAAAKGSFARALTERCLDGERLHALIDVMMHAKKELDPRVRNIGSLFGDEELFEDQVVGDFTIQRKIGESDLGIVYQAVREDGDAKASYAVKVLRREAARDKRAVHRFLTANRLVGTVSHAGLPRSVEAGELEPGLFYVAYPYIEGMSLAARLARTGAASYAELKPLLKGIIAPLAALHGAHLVHGDLKTENILVTPPETEGGDPVVTLIDFGTDRLRGRSVASNGHTGLLAIFGSPKTVSPEQVRGRPAEPASDVYAFGAVLYELLTGKPVFHDRKSATDAAFAHLASEPEPPSHRAPPGWVPKDVDALVMSCLSKDPAARPPSAQALLSTLSSTGRTSVSMLLSSGFAPDQLKKLEEGLLAAPTDLEAALSLENAVEQGADPIRVGEAFAAASALVRERTPEAIEAKKALLYRAARIFDSAGRDKVRAEQMFASIVNVDPDDEIALVALEDTRKALGKYEELVEMLVARTQAAPPGPARGRALAEIGRLYASELDDADQAVVAFTRALCEEPTNEEYAAEVERLAGARPPVWHDQLTIVAEALNAGRLPHHDQIALIARAARWYERKLGRADMALAAYKQVVSMDPAHEVAAEGMTEIYRRAQQWPELVSVLVGRADMTPSAPRARDLRTEAAEVLEVRLNDLKHSRDLLMMVISDDPGHARACEAMARIASGAGDFATLARILQGRADVSRGPEKPGLLARVAEVYEEHLGDVPEATRRYEAVLSIEPGNVQAMKGLDRIYSRSGRFRELLALLERQIEAAATPRMKIALHERIAALQDTEFLNHEGAALALEKVLVLDAAHDGAQTALARHYRALSRWEDLASLYEKHALSTGDEARRTDLLLARARVLAEQIGSPERATKTYEEILARSPQHAGALEALAQLREVTGDARSALNAIEALAVKASTPETRAEQWMRAARLLEARGDKDGAIERYKLALEANPKDVAASTELRKALAFRGNWAEVVTLLEQALFGLEGQEARAKICGELAHVQRVHMKDLHKADSAARHALELDPGNVYAVMVLGDLAFEAERFAEASDYYERIVHRVSSLPDEDAVRVLVRFMEAFGRTQAPEPPRSPEESGAWIGGAISQSRIAPAPEGTPETMPPPAATNPRMMAAVEALNALSPKDISSISRAASALFEYGDPKSAYRMQDELLKKHGDALTGGERAEALYNLGESARRSGDLEAAITPLREAIDLDPSEPRAYRALAKTFDQQGEWKEAALVRRLRLQLAQGPERFDILLEIGDILFGKLGDRDGAAKAYGEALEEKPDDRKLLTKLMQLYSEDKDWEKVCGVVLKLADFVEDPKQKSKYMHTAATIATQHLGDLEMAIDFYKRALEFDGTNERALEEALELYDRRGQHDEVERVLKAQLDAAKVAQDREKILKTLDQLGALYELHLKDSDLAVEAYEAAAAFEPEDRPRAEKLAQLYAADPKQYFERAVGVQAWLLRRNPYRVESYKMLRKLYTDAKRGDASWCLCQALSALRLATPEEERFYMKNRSENAAPAQSTLESEQWQQLMHWDLDPLVTRIFAMIQPTVLRTRTQTLEQIGYDGRYAIDIPRHPHPISQTLYYAQGVLGLSQPPVFQNTNEPGVLGMVHAQTPAILLGATAFEPTLTNQALAYLAGRHLASFRPGFYIRHLVPTGTGLKAWLFAAIRLVVPQFPVSADIAQPVTDATAYLAQDIHGQDRDYLGSIVSRLLQAGNALDLKRWVAAVDLTCDRVGLLLAHDLQVASEQLRASEASSPVAVKDRLKELVVFSVSEEYFALRAKLGVALQGAPLEPTASSPAGSAPAPVSSPAPVSAE